MSQQQKTTKPFSTKFPHRQLKFSSAHLPNQHKEREAFQYLWRVNDTIPKYNALKDQHTTSYFGAISSIRHMKSMQKVYRNTYNASMHQAEVIRNQRQTINQVLKENKGNQNMKILPYSSNLKPFSKDNLTYFQKILGLKRAEKQRQHQQYLKHFMKNRKPEKQKIKIVKTLQPLGGKRSSMGSIQSIFHNSPQSLE